MASPWKLLGLVVCLVTSQTLVNGWCQDSLENPFDEVLKHNHITGEKLSLTDVSHLTSSILRRVGCNTLSKHAACTNCLTADKIFKILKIPVSSGLNRNQFQQASIVIMDIIGNIIQRCQNSEDISQKWTYSDFEARFLSGKSHYSLQQLERFMEQLAKVYIPQKSTDGRSCWHGGNEHSFTAKDIFTHLYEPDNGASSAELGKLHSHLLLRLLKGDCIKKNNPVSDLPSPNEFDQAVFRIFGDSSSCRIKEEGLEQLMSTLKIGSDFGTGISRLDVSETCYKGRDFSDIFGLDMSRGLSQEDFRKVCPALLEQAVIGKCPLPQETLLADLPVDIFAGEDANDDWYGARKKPTKLTLGAKFGWGTLFVAIISLSAIVGALFLKFQTKSYYHFILVTMLGLATGCMIGDAFLHLIPEALGAHSHAHDDDHDHNETNATTNHTHDHDEDEAKHQEVVFRMFATCMSLYLFFLVQLIMEYFITIKPKQDAAAGKVPDPDQGNPFTACCRRKKKKVQISPVAVADQSTTVNVTAVQSVDGGHQNPAFQMEETGPQKVTGEPPIQPATDPPAYNGTENSPDNMWKGQDQQVETQGSLAKNIDVPVDKEDDAEKKVPLPVEGSPDPQMSEKQGGLQVPGPSHEHDGADHSHASSHGHGHGHAILAEQGHTAPVALAWMVTIGDAMHNFADGLAIGAALNTGLASGLSTSIAIFCHEVPQELGDIAAMISAGWSVPRALFFNFLSALTCFLGLYIGIPVAENEGARMWLFAVAAGTFIYISLADIVPEILEYYRSYHPWKVFACVNGGMMFGFLLMLVIGLFESKIKVSF